MHYNILWGDSMKKENKSNEKQPVDAGINKNKKQKIRLVDIAQRAGVSVSSVSRVSRGIPNIDEDIQKKIEDAMSEVGIDRNYFSKKISVADQMKFIALYVPDILNPFYAMIVKGIGEVTNTHNYGLVIYSSKDSDQIQYARTKRILQNNEIEGIIFIPTSEASMTLVNNLTKDKLPLVVIESSTIHSDGCLVTIDNYSGALNAVKYLISLGHREILYVAGDEQYTFRKDRYDGYCDALSNAGIPLDPTLQLGGCFDIKQAHDAVLERIESGIDFSAVFCANDMVAFAAKLALEEKGYSVPEDISIVGFGDIPLASTISLTTCSLPAFEMGRDAMFMLLDLINNRIDPPKHSALHASMKIRNSCRRNNKHFEETARKIADARIFKIGYTPPAYSEFYEIIKHGAYTMMKELSDRFGVHFEFDVAAPSEHKAVESQISIIENWVSQKYDAILVCSAGDIDKMNIVYQKAMDSGTAIYMFNMPSELFKETDLKVVSIIGYDNHYQSGYLVGKYAADKLKGNGKLLCVWGQPGYWTTSRREGFLEAIKPYPGLIIVGEERGDYVREKGRQAALNLLNTHPDAKLIYCENEEMAQGALQAIEELKIKTWDGNEGIITIGADGLKTGYNSIRNGALTATVNVSPVEQGREFITAVFMHEALGYSIDSIINVPTNVVDASNVATAAAYTDWALGTIYP